MRQRQHSETVPPRRSALGIEDYLVRLGDRVRAARAKRGMSRKILARDSGVSERYLAQLESGRGNPSVAVLHQIADAMDMAVMELADPHGGTDPAMTEILSLLAPLDADELSEAARLLDRRFAGSSTRGRRIALIGLRGAGKTTLGRALAEKLGFPFIELNRVIEKDYGASIGELLSLSGQPAFRRYENRCLNQILSDYDEAVISTGGGIVANPETYTMLLRRAHTIWLQASPEEHMQRVVEQGDMRPMEQNREAMTDLRAILEARAPLYNRAEASVDTAGETLETSLAKLTETARGLIG
ncbi:MAG: helix-turn-helix transcriptional regulator [Nisaea sp.]|uniref:helix-turn-helix transcriptional regulator n=1 Tax=Nisaea sp. TaxID=2024842 RepID=UPI001B009CB4|nr:helix-turn-helix transcriptional regulator [Nisaea sp.]MBO6559401.1 helix-turn-helix transcriptional regulator [Nisaea sp.]